mmetsp:Transcript_14319/g.24039  ORF Transcript_14319/g.24039 Transcript_14319/m.24039 type:complete len:616 (+) Transcript_14319:63-1910(+)
MEGFLYKKSSGLLSKWQKRYFCVDETGLDYLRENETVYMDRFAGTHIDLRNIQSVELTKEGFSIIFHNGKITQLKGPPNTSRSYIKDFVRTFRSCGVRTKGLAQPENKASNNKQPRDGWGGSSGDGEEKQSSGPVVVNTNDAQVNQEDLSPDMASTRETKTGRHLEPEVHHNESGKMQGVYTGHAGQRLNVVFRPQMSIGVDYQNATIVKVLEETQAWNLGVEVGMAMEKINGEVAPDDDEDLQGLLVMLVRGSEKFEITFKKLSIKELAERGFQYKTKADLDESKDQLPEMNDDDEEEAGVLSDDGLIEEVDDSKGEINEEDKEEADVEAMLQSSIMNLHKKREEEVAKEKEEIADSSLEMVLGIYDDGEGELDLAFSSDEDGSEEKGDLPSGTDKGEDEEVKTATEGKSSDGDTLKVESDYKYSNLSKDLEDDDDDEDNTAALPLTKEQLGLAEEEEKDTGDKAVETTVEEKKDGGETLANTEGEAAATESEVESKVEAKEEEAKPEESKPKTEKSSEQLALETEIKAMKAKILKTAKEALAWKKKTEAQAKANKVEFLKLKKMVAQSKKGKSPKIAAKDRILVTLVKNLKICKQKMMLIRQKARKRRAAKGI